MLANINLKLLAELLNRLDLIPIGNIFIHNQKHLESINIKKVRQNCRTS